MDIYFSGRFFRFEQAACGVFRGVKPCWTEICNVPETGLPHELLLVPDRDRAAYSLAPRFKASDQVTRQLTLQDNVGELQPASWFENTVDFGKKFFLVRGEIDDAVRENQVKESIGIRDGVTVDMPDLNVVVTDPVAIAPGTLHHLKGQVNAANLTCFSGQQPGHDEIETGAAADIKDNTARFNGCDGKRIPHPAKSCEHLRCETVQQGWIVAQFLSPLTTGGVLKEPGSRLCNLRILGADSSLNLLPVRTGQMTRGRLDRCPGELATAALPGSSTARIFDFFFLLSHMMNLS